MIRLLDKMTSVYTWTGGIVSGLLAFFAPLKLAFIVIFVVIAFDFLTGVWASYLNRVSLSSRRFRNSVKKVVGYFEVIFILFIIERGFGFDFASWRFVGGFICFIELFSILENTATITNNKVFLAIIKVVRGRAKNTYGDVIEEILNEKSGDGGVSRHPD